jgi:hypothetical protein
VKDYQAHQNSLQLHDQKIIFNTITFGASLASFSHGSKQSERQTYRFLHQFRIKNYNSRGSRRRGYSAASL